MSKSVVIAGGSGFVGQSLTSFLQERGYRVVVLSRSEQRSHMSGEFVHWDARTLGAWKDTLEGAVAVINLAGRSVDCIKTPANQDRILRSRVEATRVIGQALETCNTPPPVWIQMSTAHIYGDSEDVVCDESSPFGLGLAPTVGKAWEAEHAAWLPTTMRSVVLRTSFVIGKHGGPFPKLKMLTRLGLGGRVGSGKQGMSWIHEHDLNRLFLAAIEEQNYSGVYVASAPHPVSQKVFMRAMRTAVGNPIGLPAPAFAIRLGAIFIVRTDPELLLCGRYVVPTRLLEQGFEFEFPDIDSAAKSLV